MTADQVQPESQSVEITLKQAERELRDLLVHVMQPDETGAVWGGWIKPRLRVILTELDRLRAFPTVGDPADRQLAISDQVTQVRFWQHWQYSVTRRNPVGLIYCQEHHDEQARLDAEHIARGGNVRGHVVRLSPSAAKGRRCVTCGTRA